MIGGLARIAVLGVIGGLLATSLIVYRILDEGGRDDRRPADAIVVMGAAQYDGRPSPVFRSRLEHAVELFGEGLAPILIVTGGKLEGDRTTEADTARAFAMANGVPDAAILVERESRNTVESIDGVAALMAEHGLRSAIFVSDPSHMLRVRRIARDRGIEAWGSPTQTSPIEANPERRLRATAYELGALTLYFLAGSAPYEPPLGREEPAASDGG